MTGKWKIRRVAIGGAVVWRISCEPLGVYGNYWSWEEAIERMDIWSKHATELGWRA